MELSIILVNWRSSELLRACLHTVFATRLPQPSEVLVIDNSPGDGCAEMLAADFPEVRYLPSAINLGFARANNEAFLASTGRRVLFLNPDTELLPGALESLLDRLDHLPAAGVLGARLLNSDGSLQESCVQAFPTVLNQLLDSEWLRCRFPGWSLWGNRVLHEAKASDAAVEAVSGACMMMRRESFARAGMFSTDYFMYAEDVDLCRRVRELGLRVYYCPAAVVLHHGGRSSSMEERSEHMTVVMRESRHALLRRWRGRGYAALYRLSMAASAALRLLILSLAWPWRNAQGRARLGCAMRKWRAIFGWAVGRVRSGTAPAMARSGA